MDNSSATSGTGPDWIWLYTKIDFKSEARNNSTAIKERSQKRNTSITEAVSHLTIKY
jgi:hypothetical protein